MESFFPSTQRAEWQKNLQIAVWTHLMLVQRCPHWAIVFWLPPHENTMISASSHWLWLLIGCWLGKELYTQAKSQSVTAEPTVFQPIFGMCVFWLSPILVYVIWHFCGCGFDLCETPFLCLLLSVLGGCLSETIYFIFFCIVQYITLPKSNFNL